MSVINKLDATLSFNESSGLFLPKEKFSVLSHNLNCSVVPIISMPCLNNNISIIAFSAGEGLIILLLILRLLKVYSLLLNQSDISLLSLVLMDCRRTK